MATFEELDVQFDRVVRPRVGPARGRLVLVPPDRLAQTGDDDAPARPCLAGSVVDLEEGPAAAVENVRSGFVARTQDDGVAVDGIGDVHGGRRSAVENSEAGGRRLADAAPALIVGHLATDKWRLDVPTRLHRVSMRHLNLRGPGASKGIVGEHGVSAAQARCRPEPGMSPAGVSPA